MKFYSQLVFIMVLLGLGQAVSAETYKIGAVDALRVLEQSPQAEAARKMIETEFAPRDKQLVAEQRKIRDLEEKMNKDGAIMSEQERAKLEREIISAKRELKRSQDEFREDLNFRRNEEFAKIQKRIAQAVQQIAKDEGFDLILDAGVVYASDKVNITNMIIEKLKQDTGS
ncbi:MAG: OmpH family outer membrane protein [Gammaproteobacteria bacterium]